MKKVLLAGAMLAVAFQPAMAIDWGVTGGWNITQMSFDKDKLLNSDNHSGWFIGPKAQFTLPIVGLGVDASLLYSQRKLAYEVEEAGVTAYTDYKTVRSISVPLNARYNIGLGSLIGAFVATGPQFNFNLGNKDMGAYTLKNSDFSWNFGVGVKALGHLEVAATYNLPMGKTAEVDASNMAGIIGSAATDAASQLIKNDAKVNTWQISATYYF